MKNKSGSLGLVVVAVLGWFQLTAGNAGWKVDCDGNKQFCLCLRNVTNGGVPCGDYCWLTGYCAAGSVYMFGHSNSFWNGVGPTGQFVMRPPCTVWPEITYVIQTNARPSACSNILAFFCEATNNGDGTYSTVDSSAYCEGFENTVPDDCSGWQSASNNPPFPQVLHVSNPGSCSYQASDGGELDFVYQSIDGAWWSDTWMYSLIWWDTGTCSWGIIRSGYGSDGAQWEFEGHGPNTYSPLGTYTNEIGACLLQPNWFGGDYAPTITVTLP